MVTAVATLSEAFGYILIGLVFGLIIGLYFEWKSVKMLRKDNDRLRKQRREGYKPQRVDFVDWNTEDEAPEPVKVEAEEFAQGIRNWAKK